MIEGGQPDTDHSVSPDSGTHWSEPGAWPVAPGVHRIPLPLPHDSLKAINVYAIEATEGLTLVDAGWAIDVSRDLLEKSLVGLGHGLGDIRQFLVTHMHRDHYTQAVTVRHEVGSHVSLGLGEKPTLDWIHEKSNENPQERMLVACGAGHLAEQWDSYSRYDERDLDMWAYPDAWLEGDLEIAVGGRTLDAVHTPGHTQGHYVFADRHAGLLFAGDHVLPTITPSIGFQAVPAKLPLGDFMASLARVRELPDLALLPAHGPVAPSTHTRVDQLLAHHEDRLRLSLAALSGGAGTAYDVAAELPWTRHRHRLANLDFFNAALAILETRVHLDLLVARGQADRAEVDGVVRYTALISP